MNPFEIIKGFRNVYDIDRLRINIEDILSDKSYISFLRENKLKGISIYATNDLKQTIDFSFLQEIAFIEYFEFLVNLTRKSDISGIYNLHELKYLRWIANNNFDLDFSGLTTLRVLIISDYKGLKNWDQLINLKKLYISRLKRDDLTFISGLKELTDIRISSRQLRSLAGLEGCGKLERLDLVDCTKLTEVATNLEKMPFLTAISLKKCKSITKEEIAKIQKLNISFYFQ